MTTYTSFWKSKIDLIMWSQKPKIIISNNKKKFYNDGKTNLTYNCIQNNINIGFENKVAIIFINAKLEITKLTYGELSQTVDCFINFLKDNFNIINNKEKIITIHSSSNIVSAISMLACAKMGITHNVIFDDLSKDSIKTRINLTKSRLIITSCSKKDYKKKFQNFSKQKIKILHINNIQILDLSKNIKYLLKTPYASVRANKSSFILFTSGSTGVPKGIAHSTAGWLLYTKLSMIEKFGLTHKDIILTASDAGWINGHNYALYGPLSIGATTILLEKPMSLLDINFLRKILLDIKITVMYLPVTLVRLLKAFDKSLNVKSKYLRLLGSMGEPLSAFVGNWFCKKFSKKKLQIINTYYQTETGAIICSPSFKQSISICPPGSVGKPLTKHLGVFIKKNLEKKSEILIKNPWPGCLIKVLNGLKSYKNYWDKNNNFRMFDYASQDKEGNYYVYGRMDDVINISGHRVGSGEFENIILKNKKIKEACAVAIEDKLKGQGFVLFYVSNSNQEKSIKKNIVNTFGSFAVPKCIIKIQELPKTKSGKILRRLLRSLLINPDSKNIGDVSTINNPKIIFDIIKNIGIKYDRTFI
jgi:acetyl-CoA synthetase